MDIFIEISPKYFDINISLEKHNKTIAEKNKIYLPQYWENNFKNCKNIFNSIMQWSYRDSYLTKIEQNNYMDFLGYINLNYKEAIVTGRENQIINRNLQHRLPFIVRFPKNVYLKSNVETVNIFKYHQLLLLYL